MEQSSTGVTTLSCLDKMPNLETMLLKGNGIEKLSFIANVSRRIRELDISDNKLEALLELTVLQPFDNFRSLSLAGWLHRETRRFE
jgi:Leucine-rich repeat (LRR) protein